MNCINCGKPNIDSAKYCNFCGVEITSELPVNQEAVADTPVTPVSIVTQSAIAEPQVSTQPATAVPYKVQLPSATAQIVFSAINIFCCGSFILGGIALVFSLMATSAISFEDAKKKLKIALILNIVAICIRVLLVIAYILFMVVVLVSSGGEFSSGGFWNSVY